MDQNRLEELKRLLQKRHQEPKRGLEQNSNGENFKAPNSETKNSEVSNFEALNSEVSNFESLNPGASNSEFPNSEISNYETQNSKAPNSDPDALNLESKTAQNSTAKDNVESQNFISDDSDSLRQNSKARDYDKDPLIIKDHTYYEFMIYQFPALLIGFIIFLTFVTIVNPVSLKTFRMLPFILVSLLTVIRDKDGMYFEFKNDKILYYHKNKIRKIFELNSIGAMVISFDCRHSMRQRVNWFIKIALLLWLLLAFVANSYDVTIGEYITNVLCLFVLAASGIFGAKPLMHLRNGSLGFFGLHDQLVLYKENAEVEILNILMANKEEYLQLRDYFMQTIQKDISNLQRTMSIFNEKIEFRKFKF
ncbi:hypothetical protein [uncultured Campylobacter sp.]|uniref:hypothetical protein n=1 Tax=uncultured Campylobacter sp. TaxID=218934 RepID=UPI00261160B7|nr:hypothetical protein [uncultured Campylobacter sp.]